MLTVPDWGSPQPDPQRERLPPLQDPVPTWLASSKPKTLPDLPDLSATARAAHEMFFFLQFASC